MASIDEIIEERVKKLCRSFENRVKSLEEEVKSLNSVTHKQGVWMTMNEVESKFGISKRTQYRKMESNEYKWKKPNGGQRIILVDSLYN